MFTVKVLREDESGRDCMSYYEATSVDVYPSGVDRDGLQTNLPCIEFTVASGDRTFLVVGAAGDYIPKAVFVENSSGKTTDVIRAPK